MTVNETENNYEDLLPKNEDTTEVAPTSAKGRKVINSLGLGVMTFLTAATGAPITALASEMANDTAGSNVTVGDTLDEGEKAPKAADEVIKSVEDSTDEKDAAKAAAETIRLNGSTAETGEAILGHLVTSAAQIDKVNDIANALNTADDTAKQAVTEYEHATLIEDNVNNQVQNASDAAQAAQNTQQILNEGTTTAKDTIDQNEAASNVIYADTASRDAAIAAVQERAQQVQQSYEEAAVAVQDAQTKLATAEDALAFLNQQAEDARVRYEQAAAAVNELQAQYDALKSTNADDAALASAQAALLAAQDELADATNARNAAQGDQAAKQKEIDDLNAEIVKLTNEKNTLQSELERLQAQKEKLESELATLKQEAEDLRNQANAAQDKVTNTQTAANTVNNAASALGEQETAQDVAHRAESTLNGAKQDEEAAKGAYDSAVSANDQAQKDLTDANQAQKDAANNVSNKQTAADDAAEKAQDAATKADEAAANVTKTEQEAKDAAQTTADAQAELSKQQEAQKQLEAANQTCKDALSEAKNDSALIVGFDKKYKERVKLLNDVAKLMLENKGYTDIQAGDRDVDINHSFEFSYKDQQGNSHIAYFDFRTNSDDVVTVYWKIKNLNLPDRDKNSYEKMTSLQYADYLSEKLSDINQAVTAAETALANAQTAQHEAEQKAAKAVTDKETADQEKIAADAANEQAKKDLVAAQTAYEDAIKAVQEAEAEANAVTNALTEAEGNYNKATADRKLAESVKEQADAKLQAAKDKANEAITTAKTAIEAIGDDAISADGLTDSASWRNLANQLSGSLQG